MSNILTADIARLLKIIPDSDLVITVGNSFRSDDGVGPYIAGQLSSVNGLRVIDAGYTPENVVEEVIALAPQRIIIIDAADFSQPPGTVKLVDEEDINQTTISTHAIPMNVITGIIKATIDTSVYFIGIQAADVAMGEGLSQEVKDAADGIIKFIKDQF